MPRFSIGTLMGCLLVMSCAQDDPWYLLYAIERKSDAGDWSSGGNGCLEIGRDGTSIKPSEGTAEGAVDGSFSVSLDAVGSGAEFVVKVNGSVIEMRKFDQAFLGSDRLETVAFELPDGEQRYSFQGARDCTPLVLDASQ